ncbi:MAG: T9SS type A sorting domain-containing protein [Bacteroidota bacterium]
MLIRTIILFILLFFSTGNATAQEGCTDSQADNFDAAATTNDGSCVYPTTNYSLNEIAILPDQVLETSGLAFFDNQLWTHNDAGNEDKIYQLDTMTGTILNTVIIANSENTDWEDLAQDDTHLYLGDFGNNSGSRTDLTIYKFPKSQLASGIATAEVIEFSYADQTDFTVNNNMNDYDCEAFFFYNDSLHLFSKNWVNQETRHYVVPTNAGSYVAEVRETFNVQGLITGADISEDGVVALLGYSLSGVNFMWLCFDYQGTQFFSGNKRKISLGLAINNSQTEALVFKEGGRGYVASEQFASLDAKLLSFQSEQWTTNMSTGSSALELNPRLATVFPNPNTGNVSILFGEKGVGSFECSIYDLQGKKVFSKILEAYPQQKLFFGLPEKLVGLYFVELKNEKYIWREKLFINK